MRSGPARKRRPPARNHEGVFIAIRPRQTRRRRTVTSASAHRPRTARVDDGPSPVPNRAPGRAALVARTHAVVPRVRDPRNGVEIEVYHLVFRSCHRNFASRNHRLTILERDDRRRSSRKSNRSRRSGPRRSAVQGREQQSARQDDAARHRTFTIDQAVVVPSSRQRPTSVRRWWGAVMSGVSRLRAGLHARERADVPWAPIRTARRRTLVETAAVRLEVHRVDRLAIAVPRVHLVGVCVAVAAWLQ